MSFCVGQIYFLYPYIELSNTRKANFDVQGIMKGIKIFLSLGSNLGDRLAYLEEACKHIELKVGKIESRSDVYEALAVGVTDQPNFLNQVIKADCILNPDSLLHILQQVEKNLGRKRIEHWGPRTIDIDILFYGEEIIRTKSLEIPHPEAVNRLFVLLPMNDIAPNYIHPSENQSIVNLMQKIPNKGQVWPYKNVLNR